MSGKEDRLPFFSPLSGCFVPALGSGAQVGPQEKGDPHNDTAALAAATAAAGWARQQGNTLGFKSTQSILGN